MSCLKLKLTWWTQIEFDESVTNVPRPASYVARVKKLLLVRLLEHGALLRIALLDVFKKHPDFLWADPDLGTMYKCREYYMPGPVPDVTNNARTFVDVGIAVPLASIVTKVVRATQKKEGCAHHYFQKYSFSSGIE